MSSKDQIVLKNKPGLIISAKRGVFEVLWFSKFVHRYAKWIAILGTLFAVIGGYYSVLLYKNLRTDIQELLPTTARSVLDVGEVSQRLQSIDSLAVLVFSSHTKESKRFVEDLAEKLEQAPKNTVAGVEYRLDREIKFFKERQALFIDVKDLIQIREYIRQRIQYERELYNPLNIFRSTEIPEPKLNFLSIKGKYSLKAEGFEHFPNGYFATPDETKRVLLVNLPGSSDTINATHRLKSVVENTIAELNPSSYAPDLTIRYAGGVENTIEEQSALVEDLELSTVIVTLIVSLAMLLYYRDIRSTLALILSLFMGTFWTFGAAYYLVGYLNANSAFLGSIVLGNGINFGIIFLARYTEELRNGSTHGPAQEAAVVHTTTSTWTAALAAALSYGSLMLTGFRGFRQFGIIGFVGMVLCWISAYTVLPALLTLFNGKRTPVRESQVVIKRDFSNKFAVFINSACWVICGLTLIATVASLQTFTKLSPDILETDLSRLRNKRSMTEGSGHYAKYVDEIFQHYLSPMAILPHSRENARKIAKALQAKKDAGGKTSPIASVQTMDQFIPENQPEKIKILRQIQRLLPERLIARLSPEDVKLVRAFLNPASFQVFAEKDLPILIQRKFTEKNGAVGKMVLVEPPLDSGNWPGEKLIEFVDILRTTADAIEPNTPVAGGLAVTSDMIRAISKDGPQATLFALISVVVLVILLFRNLKTISLVLFALFLGVIWLAGIILGFKLKINFLNFIALPITFGIGVDYGVNIFQRYRESAKSNILAVIKNTGSAVGLSSFTTSTGYASLLIASNQGFVSFGALAVAGELTCVIAAVIALPAFLVLMNRRRQTQSS